jgi:hypothetical protein
VGDVDVAQAEELIKKYFGHLESGPGLGDEVRALCVCCSYVGAHADVNIWLANVSA